MKNYILLEKHKKKLSIYFALFILFSLWITQGIFLISTYFTNSIKLERKLEWKLIWVINILNNKEEYSKKINENDITLEQVVRKSLEEVTILENWNIVLWNINNDLLNNTKNFLNYNQYKYFFKSEFINNKNYTIIIKSFDDYSYNRLINEYIFFIIFSLPFLFIFYFIWYIFVWKNLKPIKETILSLETFSANINHEMKTPLSEIISTLSLSKKTKKYEEAIEQSLESSNKLNKILDSMFWIINLVDSSYKKERFDLIQELKNIIKEYDKELEKKNIKIEYKFSNKFFYWNLNKEHFDICISNIFKNAIKYSNKNSIIKINFNNWKIEIIDFWIWINEENLNNIFDTYFRENYIKVEWLGLWLSLVKKITDLHWWKINIKSEKWKWTNVSIYFY